MWFLISKPAGQSENGELNAFFYVPAVNGIYIDFSDVYRNSQLPKAVLLKDIKQVLLISLDGREHNINLIR
jgi:hypothetical protein